MARHISTDQLVPLEIDDEYISEAEIKEQPLGELSLTTGFNAEKRILTCLASLDDYQTPDIHSPINLILELDGIVGRCDCGRTIVPVTMAENIASRLHKLRYMLDDLPEPLSEACESDATSDLHDLSKRANKIDLQRSTYTLPTTGRKII